MTMDQRRQWHLPLRQGLLRLVLITAVAVALCCSRMTDASSNMVLRDVPSKPLAAPLLLEKPEPERRDPRERPAVAANAGQLRATSGGSSSGKKKQELEPLMITPYLEAGDAATARDLSKVGHIVDGLQDSHAGYFTVNKDLGSNLFFWLFKAKSGNTSTPLLLWLNGGPGTSSLLGILLENGPLTFNEDTLEPILASWPSWTDDFDVLYIDQPVGAGFSYTDDISGFPTTQPQYTADLFEAVAQFFQLFPDYLEKDFYLTGISYGGKFVPSLAEKLHTVNQEGLGVKYPLTGIVTINGLTDPATAFPDFGTFLYQHGLLDPIGLQIVDDQLTYLTQAISNDDWLAAVITLSDLSDSEKGLLRNLTGYQQIYNIGDPLSQGLPDVAYSKYPDFVNQPQIRDAIHVGSTPFGGGYDTQAYLALDLPQSVKSKLELIMDNGYKVLLLNGNLDMILGPRTCTAMLQNTNWKYSEEYRVAEQELYEDNGKVVGYLTKVHNLWQAKVIGGTHYAPANVPKPIYSILKEFIAADISERTRC